MSHEAPPPAVEHHRDRSVLYENDCRRGDWLCEVWGDDHRQRAEALARRLGLDSEVDRLREALHRCARKAVLLDSIVGRDIAQVAYGALTTSLSSRDFSQPCEICGADAWHDGSCPRCVASQGAIDE